ncbi:MAG TPA: hypothetical protein VFJ58_28590 [Armatimonadota bacterium]|nr:hypothetical protein [Armatimonadota bacterium]
MPFKRINADETVIHPELVEEIARELEARQPEGPTDAPLILEEQVPRTDRFYVSVIWDRWAQIPNSERGRIIIDAYQKVRGSDETLKISAALGLTHKEARELGVHAELVGA